jgi:hypothetical protein
MINPSKICDGAPAGTPCEAPCAGDRGPDGRCVSCAAILAKYPGVPSGVFAIARKNNPTQPIAAYCDMASFGGGWLLVGRSVEDATTDLIGWKVSHGSVFDDAQVYSLDTQQLAFMPTEMLFGSRATATATAPAPATGKEWGANVYRAELPPDFVAMHGTKAINIVPRRTSVKGNCSGGALQAFIGHTDNTDGFFFRDNGTNDRFGLRSDGFDANDDTTCGGGGRLSDEQAMIFVR